uniref:Uncharacterized protein n=1 Tax=Oryza nivara TaxID=4536 RepID=A0A0E0J8A3_ORYNI
MAAQQQQRRRRSPTTGRRWRSCAASLGNDGAIRLTVIPTTSVVDQIGIYDNDGGGGEEEVLSIVVHDDDPDNSRGLVPGDNLTVCGRGFVVGYGESETANPPPQPSIS